MAPRIQRIRLQRSLSFEEVEAKTGLTKSLIARPEKGQEVPKLEMLDTLAEALDVPIHVFFYDIAPPEPRLTPRPALKELAEECDGPATAVLLPIPKSSVLAASRGRRVSRLRPSGSI